MHEPLLALLLIVSSIAIGVVAWFAVSTLLELRATLRTTRESVTRLTPLTEEALRQVRDASASLASATTQVVRVERKIADWADAVRNVPVWLSAIGGVVAAVKAFVGSRRESGGGSDGARDVPQDKETER